MKILYLSYLTDEDVFNNLFKAELEPSVARHKFETAFMSSLLDNSRVASENITIISMVPYNCNVLKRPIETEFKGNTIKYIWWGRGIKSSYVASVEVQRLVQRWCDETCGQERVMLTYATNPLLLFPLLNRKCKMVTICSEVPRFRVLGDSWRAKVKKEYYHFLKSTSHREDK